MSYWYHTLTEIIIKNLNVMFVKRHFLKDTNVNITLIQHIEKFLGVKFVTKNLVLQKNYKSIFSFFMKDVNIILVKSVIAYLQDQMISFHIWMMFMFIQCRIQKERSFRICNLQLYLIVTTGQFLVTSVILWLLLLEIWVYTRFLGRIWQTNW